MLERLLAFALVATALAACERDTARTAAGLEADVAAIEAVNARILGALNAGDWARLNELTHDEYVAIINGRPIAGRERLEASNQGFLERWQDEEAWLPDETVVDGDLAFQRGAFTMTLTPRQSGGEPRALDIYQRKADRWELTRAMAATAGE
jgi:ketosteroid isomerase-like protein